MYGGQHLAYGCLEHELPTRHTRPREPHGGGGGWVQPPPPVQKTLRFVPGNQNGLNCPDSSCLLVMVGHL